MAEVGLTRLALLTHDMGDTVGGDLLARRAEVVEAVQAAGFSFVALDLEGFRSGSMNRMLAATGPDAAAEAEPEGEGP